MGACASGELKGAPEEVKKAKHIQRQLDMDQEKEEEIHKLLLLGAGESGKSTLFKQMLLIYGHGFTPKERESYRSVIHANLIMSMQELILQAETHFEETRNSKFNIDPSSHTLCRQIQELKIDERFTPEIARMMRPLWRDPAIQEVFRLKDSFQIPDTAAYYFDRMEALADRDYIPTEEDVLRARSRTTGVVENAFTVQGNEFVMVDVGGQRSERKKWMHCFESVSCVLFVAALSAYNQTLFEDGKTNRLVESLTLFDEVCNSRWFRKTSMILFLNKSDLFAEKIKRFPLTVCPALADYEGDLTDFGNATKYIEEEFLMRNKTPRTVFAHVTCATDRRNVQIVFNSVKETVLKISLERAGLVVT